MVEAGGTDGSIVLGFSYCISIHTFVQEHRSHNRSWCVSAAKQSQQWELLVQQLCALAVLLTFTVRLCMYVYQCLDNADKLAGFEHDNVRFPGSFKHGRNRNGAHCFLEVFVTAPWPVCFVHQHTVGGVLSAAWVAALLAATAGAVV